jgi:hypothetical protein
VSAGANGSSASRARVAIQYRRLLMRHWSDLKKEGFYSAHLRSALCTLGVPEAVHSNDISPLSGIALPITDNCV